MKNDLFVNDHYHPQGAYEIEMRVRNRQRQITLVNNEEELEKIQAAYQKLPALQ